MLQNLCSAAAAGMSLSMVLRTACNTIREIVFLNNVKRRKIIFHHFLSRDYLRNLTWGNDIFAILFHSPISLHFILDREMIVEENVCCMV